MCQQSRPGQAALNRAARRRRLHDHIATRAAQLGTHVADHLEAGRHVLQNLGDIFAELLQRAAALRAGLLLWLMGLDLARQMLGQRTPRRLRCRWNALVVAGWLLWSAAQRSARFASRSSSFSSSCSICRSTFSDLRPNCMRRSLAISSFRCSISCSRESNCIVLRQDQRLQRILIQGIRSGSVVGVATMGGVCHELWLMCTKVRLAAKYLCKYVLAYSDRQQRISGSYRPAPIDAFAQHRNCARVSDNRATLGLRPHKTSTLQTLGKQAKPIAIEP